MSWTLCNPTLTRLLEQNGNVARQHSAIVRGDQQRGEQIARQEQRLTRPQGQVRFQTLATIDTQPDLAVDR